MAEARIVCTSICASTRNCSWAISALRRTVLRERIIEG